ncbi:ATP-binding protein [Kitasatospora viridis]|uniref:Putative ATPase n=1 Tax=Kitasatospora viridis TaxID=281105 RepID=A0A561T7J5_9ACTN|nr:tetratricopeptide repeat protein [Kitasatospora viridis]TWF83084.1 putative ATPase [Kitasatospora viridis]
MPYWTALPDGLEPAERQLVERLRALKDERQLTLKQLEGLTHYSHASWQRWLNGRRPITREALESLIGALDVDGTGLRQLFHAAQPADEEPQAPRAERTEHAQEPDEPPAPPATPGTPARDTAPCQLPADTRAFTGRTRELADLLDRAREAAGGGPDGPVVVCAIDGMGGVGKSALAVHAAHRVRRHFPDGQLFIDLHGHTDLEPVSAADALDWLLRSLDVPAQTIPADQDQRAALYRERLAGTRTLIVLDNAIGAAQIRPLLPGLPGCLVLVTSRKRLTGLDDAHSVSLATLPPDEAAGLLLDVAGLTRLSPDAPAIRAAVGLCGNLPLALRIVAARLRHRGVQAVDGLVARLHDENARLVTLQDEDRNLAAVFEASYGALPAAEQRLFRLLGQLPGTEFDVWTAANLAGTDLWEGERLLDSLLDHNLLIQHAPERYHFHDLVRLYARTLAELDPPAERAAALDRLLGYYVHTARQADRHLNRFTRPGLPAALPAGPPVGPELPDRAAALDWLRAEQENLLTLVRHARAHQRPDAAGALTGELSVFLRFEGRWQECVSLQRAVITTARETGDGWAEANALCDISRISLVSGDFPQAVEACELALAVYLGLGDRLGEANALHELGRVRYLTGEFESMAEVHGRALALYRDLGDRRGQANTLHELGSRAVLVGDYAAAATLLQEAMAIHRELDDPLGRAHVLVQLGRTTHSTGDSAAAADMLAGAVATYQELGLRQGEASAAKDLGTVLRATGDHQAAAELQERSLRIYRELGNRHGIAGATEELGLARLAAGELAPATELLEAAVAIFQELGAQQAGANALTALARARHRLGEHGSSEALLERSLATHRTIGDHHGEAQALLGLAEVRTDSTGPRVGLPLYREAHAMAQRIGSPADEARALDGAAHCLELLGDGAAAIAALREAVTLYQRTNPSLAVSAALRLAGLEHAN